MNGNQQPSINSLYIDEEFRPIISIGDDIKNYYIISNYGRIFNYISGVEIIPHKTESGYLQASLMTTSGRVFRKVHRLVMMTFFYFEGCEAFQVNHKNGDKENNAYWNLEWSTPKENIAHAISTGLRSSFKGELNPTASISDAIAREIGCQIMSKIPDEIIANNLCNGNISIVKSIATGKAWVHLFTDDELKVMKLTRRGNIIIEEDIHRLCLFFQNNINAYSGYGAATKLIRDALENIGLDSKDNSIFRFAKRIFYKYEKSEITSLYIY